MMRLAIVGSRTLAGNARAARLIEDLLDLYRPTCVVSGGAVGIDTMAVRAARRRWRITTVEHLPTTQRWHGRGGFKERNEAIARGCDRLVRIFDAHARTYGSGWTATLARGLGKPVEEWRIDGDTAELVSSIGGN